MKHIITVKRRELYNKALDLGFDPTVTVTLQTDADGDVASIGESHAWDDVSDSDKYKYLSCKSTRNGSLSFEIRLSDILEACHNFNWKYLEITEESISPKPSFWERISNVRPVRINYAIDH